MLKFEQLSVQLFCWLCQFVTNNVDHFSLQYTLHFFRRAVHSKCISLSVMLQGREWEEQGVVRLVLIVTASTLYRARLTIYFLWESK